MSKGINYLHSHSQLESSLGIPKHIVLVDAEYYRLFTDVETKPFRYFGIDYIKVPTITFVKRGGAFKCLQQ